jgi:hypothetical protein
LSLQNNLVTFHQVNYILTRKKKRKICFSFLFFIIILNKIEYDKDMCDIGFD